MLNVPRGRPTAVHGVGLRSGWSYPGNSLPVSKYSYADGGNILQGSYESFLAKKSLSRIAVVGNDPLQFVGLRAVFDSERDFELISSSLSDVGTQQKIDLVLLREPIGPEPVRTLSWVMVLQVCYRSNSHGIT
jgi:hypothetical protein